MFGINSFRTLKINQRVEEIQRAFIQEKWLNFDKNSGHMTFQFVLFHPLQLCSSPQINSSQSLPENSNLVATRAATLKITKKYR